MVLEDFFGAAGKRARGFFRVAAEMFGLLGQALYWSLRVAVGRAHVRRSDLFAQMVRVGVDALPIVVLCNVFVGMILAVSTSELLDSLGVLSWIAQVIAVATTRELAPLMTAIIMSGFVGAAMAAEIGAMTASEEVLALETSALNPIRFLVVPRLWAVMAMLPCLTVIADVAGMFGGYAVGTLFLGIGPVRYLTLNNDALYLKDVIAGLVKSEAFAVIITVVACQQGLAVRGGAVGVGRATTNSVVYSIFLLIFSNLFFATVFNYVMA
ncbi:MAG: ABC transporter permease [Planctomycetes bacterium]|nr:ABC transporter permease [Planctomycetota bacterium]